jgi:hypothetical protein
MDLLGRASRISYMGGIRAAIPMDFLRWLDGTPYVLEFFCLLMLSEPGLCKGDRSWDTSP